jgi:hypothetical protein
MPDPTVGLVAGIAHLFDVSHAPNPVAKLRQALPTILVHFFPWARWDAADARGMSFYLADCVMLYALQRAKDSLPHAHLRAFADEFCAALSVARKITQFLEVGEDIAMVAEHGVRRFLRDGRAVLCPGGANLGTDGHAVMMLLLPQPGGNTLCAVFNRGEGLEPWHHRDAQGKPQPWLALISTQALCGVAGEAPLHTLLALQVPAKDNTMDAFYTALNALVQSCDGTRWLSGAPAVEGLSVPGQSLQKASECTISNTFGAMNFLMQVQLRCWHEPPSCSPAEAHDVYLQIKYACRKVILCEIIAERDRAIQDGDTPQIIALTHALCGAAAFIRARVQAKPEMQRLYDALPADIRVCAEEATNPSVV